jgi:hypothetical protein
MQMRTIRNVIRMKPFMPLIATLQLEICNYHLNLRVFTKEGGVEPSNITHKRVRFETLHLICNLIKLYKKCASAFRE